MDETREERAERRRRTWSVSPLDAGPEPANDPVENLRRLEQLRRAACQLRGKVYPEGSTPAERREWPWELING